MNKQNCWEYKQCGREPDGAKTAELGICPVALEARATGINGGHMGGRSCWAISQSLCGGKVQGDYLGKLGACMSCPFYKQMVREEGMDFVIGAEILKILNGECPKPYKCSRSHEHLKLQE